MWRTRGRALDASLPRVLTRAPPPLRPRAPAQFTLIMREHADFLVDRFAERKEIVAKGRLLTQAEKEKAKDEAMIESGKTAAK